MADDDPTYVPLHQRRNAPPLPEDSAYKGGQKPFYRFHRGLPPPGSVSDADGPVVRIGSLEWVAWMDYYQKQKRWFSAKMMEHYAAHKTDWPVTTQWPPGVTQAMKDKADADQPRPSV